jgi:hypothetical protein
MPLWLIYTVVPVLDQIIPVDNINPTAEEEEILKISSNGKSRTICSYLWNG